MIMQEQPQQQPPTAADSDDRDDQQSDWSGREIDCLPEQSALRRDCLVALASLGRAKGHDIHMIINDGYGGGKIPSATYIALDTLVEDGLVNRRDDPDDARANEYALTSRGQRKLVAYRNWVAFAMQGVARDDESEDENGGDGA